MFDACFCGRSCFRGYARASAVEHSKANCKPCVSRDVSNPFSYSYPHKHHNTWRHDGSALMVLISTAISVAQLRQKQSMTSHGASPLRLVEPASDPGAVQFQYQNFQSRSRLDARLWLSCRLALVHSLMGEVTGLGQVKGQQLATCSRQTGYWSYCKAVTLA